jgi:sugar phosphate isomerase/epimerase
MTANKQHRLGIFSWFGFVLPLPQRLTMIKNAGFYATTLWWEDEMGFPGIKKESMPNMVRDSGLILENIHIPYDHCDDLWSDHKPTRDAIVAQYTGWINDCAQHGIPIMVMHITDSLSLPATHRNAKYGLDSISRLLRAAEDLKITLALENTGREDYIDLVFSQLQSDYLGFCYDSSHHRIYSEGKLDFLKKISRHIVTTHLSDNDGKQDRHWLPGEGVIDWHRLTHIFSQIQYDHYVTLEVCASELQLQQSPESFLAQAYQSAAWISELIHTR